MNCPVCQVSGLPDDLQKCPQCGSDLEVFEMSRKIVRQSKSRLGFAIVASILFVAMLLIWFFSGRTGTAGEHATEGEPSIENAGIKAELDQVKSENERLTRENTGLQQQLENQQEEREKRIKEYAVQNGESLFSIARKVYGNGFRYVDLAGDNNIEDPDFIRTGQKLIIYY